MTTPDRPMRVADVRAYQGDGVAAVPAQRTPVSDTATTTFTAHDDGASTHDLTDRAGVRRDRVRWGPIWAGTVGVLTTFLVLPLLFFALGWLDLGFDAGGSAVATAVVSGVLGLVAFLVGGLTASASTMWRGASDGVLQGVIVWAVSVVIILALTLLSGTAVLGPLANVLAQTPGLTPRQINIDPAQVLATARQSAGWAALGLGLGLGAGAAALGGLAGAKMWSSRGGKGTRA